MFAPAAESVSRHQPNSGDRHRDRSEARRLRSPERNSKAVRGRTALQKALRAKFVEPLGFAQLFGLRTACPPCPRASSRRFSRWPPVLFGAMDIILLGDSALMVRVREQFADAPDETLDEVLRVFQMLQRAAIPGVIELAPAYTSVAVFFDPHRRPQIRWRSQWGI